MINSRQNPLVKQIRKLQQQKARQQENLLLLEGTNLMEAACQSNYPLKTVCCTSSWQENHPQLWQQLVNTGSRIELVSPEVLAAIATTVNPDGIIATAERLTKKQSISASQIQLGLVLEKIQDPGNLGTIIRSAVATNTSALWLTQDSVAPDNPKVLRASVGAWFQLPIIVSDNLSTLIQNYQSQGIQIVAGLAQASQTYWEIDLTKPTMILLGNESAGLSSQIISLADYQVKIPLNPKVESLNVAITAALLLYEAQRQRQLLGK